MSQVVATYRKNGDAKRAFHNSAESLNEYAKQSIQKALDSGLLSKDDALLIKEFVAEVRAVRQISASRAFKITSILVGWRNFIGPFTENTIADVFEAIHSLQTAKKSNGDQYKKNTQRDYVLFLKRFYLWMIENGYSSIPEKKICSIRPPSKNNMTKTAEQLLTEDEVKRMIEECRISRDRAIIAMLYEGGFRVGEIGKLCWKQVKFNDWNVVINVDEKTGKPRYVPLVMARAYLAQWKADYPLDPKGDSHVFLTATEGRPLQYRGVAKQLSKIANRASIEKHITPHIFRHSRITHLIQKGYSESIIKKMMWGNINTAMFVTYAHLTDADIEREIAVKEGVEEKAVAKRSRALEPRQCSRCFTINAPTQSFCGECGLPLTEEAAVELKEAKTEIQNDTDYKKMYEELLRRVSSLENKIADGD